MHHNKIIFIVGPTAVGKTEVAFRLAQQMQAEIVSCDAMQVYREVSIATNTPLPEMLRSVPHHCVHVVEPSREFDVAAYNDMALQAVRDIFQRQKTVVITGGSGLYMQVLLDGIFQGAPKERYIRDELWQRFEAEGREALIRELKARDPMAAQRIHPHDTRRIIRALEVCLATDQPFSKLQKERQGLWGKYEISLYALTREREDLYDRINRRVDQMFEQGLMEEIGRLRQRSLSLTARRIIGFREVSGCLDHEYDESRARYLMKLHTRHYAKRQLTWFRKDNRIQWIFLRRDAGAAEPLAALAKAEHL